MIFSDDLIGQLIKVTSVNNNDIEEETHIITSLYENKTNNKKRIKVNNSYLEEDEITTKHLNTDDCCLYKFYSLKQNNKWIPIKTNSVYLDAHKTKTKEQYKKDIEWIENKISFSLNNPSKLLDKTFIDFLNNISIADHSINIKKKDLIKATLLIQ